MRTDLTGKTAVVTGGSRGIGRGIVELFVARGARVLFTGMDESRGREVETATGATFLQANAALEETAARIRDGAAEMGGADILVSNAGTLGAPSGVEGTTSQALWDTLAVHLRAPWMLMNELVPQMRTRGGGSIVTIGSVAGHRVGATSAAYSVAKAALIHLTRCAAAEFGSAGIRVNSVSPGFIATAIHSAALPDPEIRGERFTEGLRRYFLHRQALPRTGTTDDIAELVAFLASDASAFISGSDIIADGGMMWGRSGFT